MVDETMTVPVAKELTCSQDEIEEMDRYIELSEKLGVTSTNIFERHFELFAASNGIRVYDNDVVSEFMRQQAEAMPVPHIFVWKPLRGKDLSRLMRQRRAGGKWVYDAFGQTFPTERWVRRYERRKFLKLFSYEWETGQWSKLHGNANDQVYDQPIPYPVLLTVEKIEKRFETNDELVFMVSDLTSETVRPLDADPFLAVYAGDSRLFIVERWDEPSFCG